MEDKTILITGAGGYLGSNLTNHLSTNNTVHSYSGDVRSYKPYNNLDIVIHFASPSDDYEFTDTHKTVTTIIDGSLNMLKLASINDAKFVFASTMGVHNTNIADTYCACKLAVEKYIMFTYNKYMILRIPRVYSKCRKKGLMRKLREKIVPDADMLKVVEYLPLQEFIDQTLTVLNTTKTIYEYCNLRQRTLKDIERCYV